MQKARPTHNKRQREQKLIQKRKDKAERRLAVEPGRGPVVAGEDPDLAGIKPGPQPSPWADMMGGIALEPAEKDDDEKA